MAIEKPAVTNQASDEEASRKTLKSNKESLKDLAAGEAPIKGGAKKVADPDEGGE